MSMRWPTVLFKSGYMRIDSPSALAQAGPEGESILSRRNYAGGCDSPFLKPGVLVSARINAFHLNPKADDVWKILTRVGAIGRYSDAARALITGWVLNAQRYTADG